MVDAPARKKVTINTLMSKMRKGEPITQLAAYDYRTAVIADRLGIDILCVSDTGGMILFGHKSTVSVSFDEVMMMSKAIDRGSKYGLESHRRKITDLHWCRSFFRPMSKSLIPRSLSLPTGAYNHGGSSATPPSASLYRERIILFRPIGISCGIPVLD
jgi:hypothetical protein